MWDSEEFSCRDCHMAFRSGGLLDKHKARFCLGSDIGDPAVLRQGRVEFAKPERSTWRGLGPSRTTTPALISRAACTRQIKAGAEGGDPQGSTTDSAALRRLTNEFLKLRMSIQESMSSLPQQPVSESVSAVPEVSQVARGERLREMWEQHGHQLAEIRAHTGHLEQQREEIERRLAALSGLSSTAHLESLLQELREQEERNEEALQHLRTQISVLQAQQQRAKDADAPPDFPEDRRTQHVTFDLISSVDGPLSNQIRSLRLAYMQSGGSDPEILAQMHDLQAEAHTLEQSQLKEGHKNSKRRVKLRPQAAELTSLESDNQQLEQEIFRIQLLRQRHRGEEAGAEFQLMQRQQLQQLAGLQGEIESLRHEVARTRANRQAPPPPPPPLFPGPGAQLHPYASPQQRKAQTSLLSRHLLNPRDTLGPAPYDPAAGFVMFYDMVVGVDATLTALRLVVGLFCLGQELGRPTPLPPVQCQPAGSLPYPYSMPTGNYAILSAKQPVPRIQPSPSLSLLVEVQAAGGLDPYGQDLVSRGWTRLQLFDQHNQVLSGYWRVPIRILPVKPSLSSGQLNSVSQLGNMELCLRVTNARDGEVQSLAEIDPSHTSHYKYPALASGTYGGSAPPHLTALQPFSNSALSAPSSIDQVDPPTVEESSQSDLQSVREEERKMECFGIIIDRVKGAASGQGSVRLTGYSLTSGQPREDRILILRFYHLPTDGAELHRSLLRQKEVAPWETAVLAGNLSKHEECVVAWGAIRLTRSTSQGSRRDERASLWNTGTHLVPLYCTPVPPVISLSPLPDECLVKNFKPYSVAEIRLHIYSGQATPFPLPPESLVPSADQNPPTLGCEAGFSERVRPPVQPFCQGNVVILHIDGARFLPDCSTISRVMGGVFDHHYNQ
ncbi:coiled-coil domain-containing protein 17 [Alosa sapidissima]|uniref:coiled-coil domain-containing protein 17 n=1 Tax=Alosa sapidissima TaxID=34773 RepID=UPI001C08C345|nr:coiled-coil domain-containing protein 17 [Alosa sapidissima]